MSSLGAPPVPPPYVQPTLPPRRPTSEDIPSWVVVVAAFVAFALAGLLAFVFITSKDDSAPPAPAAGRQFPAHWNKKIAPLARITAHQRGLEFEHPVKVRFLSPKAFRKTLRADDGKVTPRDRKQLQQAAGEMRALGLLGGHVDLARAFSQARGAEVLAYYSFQHKNITVRGTKLTPEVKATLVHELTHVLQDQHFGISKRLVQLQKANGPTSSAYDVLDAVVEGDADRMAYEYRDSVSAAQRRAIAAGDKRETQVADRGTRGLPTIVTASLAAPYVLGLGMTEAASAGDRGNDAIDRLLQHPPTHDVVLLDPFRVLMHATGATKLPKQTLPKGAKKIESGEFGAVSWYLMLAGRLPVAQALDAADGWAGDSFAAYSRGGTTCMQLTYAGRTSADTARMTSALQAWNAHGPTSASLSSAGGRLHVTSCDPGPGVQVTTYDLLNAVKAAAVRSGFATGLLRAGAPVSRARCIAEPILHHLTVAELSNAALAKSPSVQARIRAAVTACP